MAPRIPSLPEADEGHARLPHEQLVEAILGTLRKPLLELLKQEESRLADRKLESLAELAAGAAHEINTPLAVIVGEAQHLLKSESLPERRHALLKIVAKAKQIHQLLRDLWFIADATKPVLAAADLQTLAVEAWNEVQPLAKSRRVRLRRRLSSRQATVPADKKLLRQALIELLRNAVQAAPSGGWVGYRVTVEDGWAVFTVLDNGPGFTEEQREHLFDPFYSGRSAGRGKGLGLAKVWRIAQVHGGSVEAFSEPGQATRFELRIPLKRRSRTATPSQSRNGHLPTTAKPNRRRP
ncbi:MAG: HAMP domain-containing histidine kinase [Gemmatales bacterium]|nr:HAMP domain-containing histidine kinase [Gemmatales bacterium]MDW8387984.1 HAMP domain-containing sensor histidine kinase [Gemmatales bacterium]